ncbi:hypothetical protein Cs7R123_73080 [Catellatospora sp. TT07R-123]|uniref:hypothetical protein n=1 Tax=Catellatospora sp. TT07R-123 TaxID=2733863 RepID=UPI001B06EE2B|nr:hypothetical protein [Catellatospora sp. TT07R-123]GHJ49966.1 hypothetical protein Cs7R123_73080 [Catellatospora sp. TT07R-123]
MFTKIAAKAALTVAGAASVLAVSAAPAAAANVTPQWYGTVHVTVDTSTKFGGIIDGNGPDSYRFWVYCSNGDFKPGVTRWAGDQRGSFGTCPSGTTVTDKGFDLFPA